MEALHKVLEFIISWIARLVAFLVALFMWCTVGLIIYVIMICRVGIALTIRQVSHVFLHHGIGPGVVSLRTAIAFWPEGLSRVFHVLQPDTAQAIPEEITWRTTLPMLFFHTAYALVFFVTTYLLYLAITAGP